MKFFCVLLLGNSEWNYLFCSLVFVDLYPNILFAAFVKLVTKEALLSYYPVTLANSASMYLGLCSGLISVL